MKFEIDMESSLVFGIVSPIGVDKEHFITNFRQICLRNEFEFKHIKLSELILNLHPQLKLEKNSFELTSKKISKGDSIRKQSAPTIFGLYAISEIFHFKSKSKKHIKTIYIIDQLKHSEELKLFREVYGKNFYLLSLNSNLPSRIKNLCNMHNISDSDAKKLIESDHRSIDKKNGQQTRKVFEKSDFFFDPYASENEIERIFHLLYGTQVVSATEEEFGMFMAFSASTKSLDLARQVGAILVGENNDILSIGCNDVPKYGGGHYQEGEADNRDYVIGEDANTLRLHQMSEILATDISKKFKFEKPSGLKSAIYNSYVKNLLEFGRVVHAEMEAIMSMSRQGKATKNTKMYVSTFPCHNCAKHILSAGIKEVTYFEEYTKSRALDLHRDSINHLLETDTNCENKLVFKPFYGISPNRFAELFSMELLNFGNLKRKNDDDGKKIVKILQNAELRFSEPYIRVINLEREAAKVFKKLAIILKKKNEKNNKSQSRKRLSKVS